MAIFVVGGLLIVSICFSAIFFTSGVLRVSVLALIALLSVSAVFILSSIPEAKKILRLALNANEVDSPVFTDEYFFSDHGETRSYSIDPQIEGFYTLQIFSDFNVIPKKYDFKGTLQVRIVKNQKIISEEIITKSARRYYNKNARFYKSIILEEFLVPSKKASDEMTLNIKVLEVDSSAPEILDQSKVFIKVQYSRLL